MGLAKAECLAALCECVGPTLDASSRFSVDCLPPATPSD